MALVKPLEENEIESELCEFIQFFKGPLGVIPNSVRTMSRRPRLPERSLSSIWLLWSVMGM